MIITHPLEEKKKYPTLSPIFTSQRKQKKKSYSKFPNFLSLESSRA